jgi:predicted metalloprotease with PDZ domain
VAILLTTLPVLAQANRDDLTPVDVSYTCTVGKDLDTIKVALDVTNLRRPHTQLAMPNWMPGTYFIGRFGERVQDFAATTKQGGALSVVHADFQTWSVDTDGVDAMHVEYALPRRMAFFGRQAAASGPVTGFQIAGPSTFLYVVGQKDRPVSVRYQLPEGWEFSNGLRRTSDPSVRLAKDYDTFIDAPTVVGSFREQKFEVAGTPFSCMFFSNDQVYDFDMPAFADVCRRIATYQGQLFGSFPFPDYVFLFTLPGGGGLEHLNSTSIGLDPAAMKKDVTAGASVTAHEFFHAWNVKRIRPKALGPFEYEHEDYTQNLYVSEGWTSYYGDLTLVRTGIIDPKAFLALFEGYIRVEMNKEGRKLHSVAWASRNVWHRDPDEPERVDYYAKGELLGALIDLQIRHFTQNNRSLDDVMRFLNRWFAERGVGFEENDIERACTAISNHDFGEFFARHVTGTMDPPMAECFGYAGIDYSEATVTAAAFPFPLQRGRGGLRIGAAATGAPAGLPEQGGMVTSIGGRADARADVILRDHKPGDKVVVNWTKDGNAHETEVTLVEQKTMVPHIRMQESPNELQRRIRDSWFTGK